MIFKYNSVFSLYIDESSTLTQEPLTYKITILDEAIFLIIILYLAIYQRSDEKIS